EWLDVAVGDIEKAESDLKSVRSLEAEANVSRAELEALRENEVTWKTANDAATTAKQASSQAAELRDSLQHFKQSMTELAEKTAACQSKLATATEALGCAEALEPFRARRRALPALAEQSALCRYAREAAAQKKTVVAGLKTGLSKAEELYEKSAMASPLTRL